MRLPKPFYQLPVRIDAERLAEEVASLPPQAWAVHPDKVPGNSAVRLITEQGHETDSVTGVMRGTSWLTGLPYLRQVLASFGVVWSRSRLMRLAAHTGVPEHADINYNWHARVRVHIPVQTSERVRFFCGGETVHMAAGEAWIFDNWRRHRVDNDFAGERIHLVADTTGTSAFWRFACGPQPPRPQWREVLWQPAQDAKPLTETNERTVVMPAAEVQWLVDDLVSELIPAAGTGEQRERMARLVAIMESFVYDWRQLCGLHGISGYGRAEFQRLLETVRAASGRVSDGLVMRMNGVAAVQVLEKRILNHLLSDETGHASLRRPGSLLKKPVFIVAAPRSGSTLLYETLAVSSYFNNLGGEAHWLIEDIPSLQPGAPGVDSNRLTAMEATPELIRAIQSAALSRLQGPGGTAPVQDAVLLEKTPKNSLRIPFLLETFPDARFIFLWRDPRENLSSILEAWRSGGWVTYRAMPGWDGPWSLLLPPGWAHLRGKAPEQVAAWQWQTANEIAMTDLAQLAAHRRTVVRYDELIADPATTVQRLCNFLEIPFDAELQSRTAAALPLSQHTHSVPAPDKWRLNEAAVNRVLPALDACWTRLMAFR